MNKKRQHSFTLTYLIDRTGDKENIGCFFFGTEHQLLPVRPFPQAKIQTKKNSRTKLLSILKEIKN